MSAKASEFDAAGATLALSGSITQTYVDFERITKLQALADRAAAQRQKLLELTQQRVKAGLDEKGFPGKDLVPNVLSFVKSLADGVRGVSKA